MKPETVISNSQSDHSGHRQRMKKAFLSRGANNFSETDILEMLLYYILPRMDTRPKAMELLEKFGSIQEILSANPKEIYKISGLKESAEVFFALLRQVVYRCDNGDCAEAIKDSKWLREYLTVLYKGVPYETVYALHFASDGSFLEKQFVFQGDLNSVKFSMRAITESVLKSGCRYVILAHNHPSDNIVPSYEDILATNRIARHLAATEVTLLEHFIVGENKCVGMFYIDKDIE